MKILITGDYCPIGRNAELIKNEEYSKLFNGFDQLNKSVDFSVVNFECPYTLQDKPILKEGPAIKTTDENVFKALQYCGFNLLTLSNNHIKDYGSQGVIDTIECSKKYSFDIVGAGKNIIEARKPFIKEICGRKIAFINISENEFNTATVDEAGSYGLDLIDNIYLIKETKEKVDHLILIYHGGREHFQLPTPQMKKRLRFFIDNGVDAVISHHTHCFSGYEYYNDGLIVYGLGNFIFDYKKKYQKGKWTEGMSAILELVESKFELKLVPHYQGREDDSTLHLLNDNETEVFNSKIIDLNNCIEDEVEYSKKWKEYLDTQKPLYLSSLFIPIFIIRAFFILKIFPYSWLSNRNTKTLLHYIRCESHLEISKEILSDINQKFNSIK